MSCSSRAPCRWLPALVCVTSTSLCTTYVSGSLLSDAISRLDVAECLRAGWQIVVAVAPLHGRGLVQADLRPWNFMWGDEGRVYLIDFEYAYAIGSPPMTLVPSKLDGRDVLLGVRPEHLEPCGESEANFIAEVDLVEPLGADTLAHGKVDGERIIARLHAALNTVEGRMPLRFLPENRHYFDAATGARLDI